MPDVVDLIMQDHREFERLFAELENEPEKRPALLPVLATLLTAHSRAEESDVYPAAAGAGGSDDVAHSQEEHVEADQILERLVACDPTSSEFADVLAELVEAVTHHLQEEEETVLPHMRETMPADRLEALGEAFLSARAAHLGESPDSVTKAELQQQASNMDLSGTSGMSKDELQETLREEAGS